MPNVLQDKKDFQQVQDDFTSYIRDPEHNQALENVAKDRLNTYRELIYENIYETLEQCYPVLRSIHDEQKWHYFTNSFMNNHYSESPYFHEISKEFLLHLQNEYQTTDDDFPFLYELAHYEWVEVDVDIDLIEVDWQQYKNNKDFINQIPVLSPLARPLQYEFPVHKIGVDFIPREKPQQASYITIYRNREDDVNFYEMNLVTAYLINLIKNSHSLTGKEIMEIIAKELQHPDPKIVIDGGIQTLKQLTKLDIVLGCKE